MVESPQNMSPSKVDVHGVFACMQCGGCFRKVVGMVCHCAWTGSGCLKVAVRSLKMRILKAISPNCACILSYLIVVHHFETDGGYLSVVMGKFCKLQPMESASR